MGTPESSLEQTLSTERLVREGVRVLEQLCKLFVPAKCSGRADNIYNRAYNRIRGRPYFSFLRSIVAQVKPKRIMEIGVFFGEGARVMIEEAKSQTQGEIEYFGFDLFEPTSCWNGRLKDSIRFEIMPEMTQLQK